MYCSDIKNNFPGIKSLDQDDQRKLWYLDAHCMLGIEP